MKIMKKIGVKLLFPLLFIILSCSNNKPKTVIIDGKEYVAMSIPEDKTNDVLDFDKPAEPYYDDTLYEWDLGCNINEASLEIGTKVEEGDVTFVVATREDKVIFKKTKDVDFKTKKGLTIKDRLSRYLEVYGAEFFIEPGTCVFLKLEDDWRACIAMADMTLNLDEAILYFYKVDPNYSRPMTLKEWNEFIDPRYSRDDSEF